MHQIMIIATFVAWLVCAVIALRSSRRLALYGAHPSARLRASDKVRACDSILLLLQCIGILIILTVLNTREPLVSSWSLMTFGWIVSGISALMLLVLVTWLVPDLPGRALLRRIENATILVLALVTLGLSVYGIAMIDNPSSLASFCALALVGITFMLFLLSRRSIRGVRTVVQHVAQHGSHPRREATLKRLLSRWYLLLSSSAAAWVTAALLLLYETPVTG